MTLTEKVRWNVALSMSALLVMWRNETDDPPERMFTDLADYPLDTAAGFNWNLGYVWGVAEGLGVPVQALFDEVDPDWRARCEHGGLATGAGGCPACA